MLVLWLYGVRVVTSRHAGQSPPQSEKISKVPVTRRSSRSVLLQYDATVPI